MTKRPCPRCGVAVLVIENERGNLITLDTRLQVYAIERDADHDKQFAARLESAYVRHRQVCKG